MDLRKFKAYSPGIARIGVGLVFFIFGIDQIIRPEVWFAFIPQFALEFGISQYTLIYLNGAFDLIIGTLLLLGLLIRISSGLGILHLIGLVLTFGYTDIAVRDFGLLIVLISVFLQGPDRLSLDQKFRR